MSRIPDSESFDNRAIVDTGPSQKQTTQQSQQEELKRPYLRTGRYVGVAFRKNQQRLRTPLSGK